MASGIITDGYKLISKVIIETCLLNNEYIKKVCEIALKTDVNYIKTSTGFNGKGAQLKDIKLIKSIVGNQKKIKASGGIKNRESAQLFINAGCDRIGTSATLEIMKEKLYEKY